MHEKLTANITLNDEILNTSLLGSGTQTREGYVLLSFLFSSILEVPASAEKRPLPASIRQSQLENLQRQKHTQAAAISMFGSL